MASKNLKKGENPGKPKPKPGNERDERGRFVKGSTGGGGGRPKMPEDLKKAFRSHSEEACKILVGIMNDKDARNADRIKAAEIILDRGYGKPTQAVDLEGSIDAIPVAISFEGVLEEWSR